MSYQLRPYSPPPAHPRQDEPTDEIVLDGMRIGFVRRWTLTGVEHFTATLHPVPGPQSVLSPCVSACDVTVDGAIAKAVAAGVAAYATGLATLQGYAARLEAVTA